MWVLWQMRSAESLHTHSPNGTSSPPVLRTKQFLSPLQNPMAFDAAKASAPDSTLVNLKNFIGNLSVHVKTIQLKNRIFIPGIIQCSPIQGCIGEFCHPAGWVTACALRPTMVTLLARSTSLSNWSRNRLHYVGQFVRCNFRLREMLPLSM